MMTMQLLLMTMMLMMMAAMAVRRTAVARVVMTMLPLLLMMATKMVMSTGVDHDAQGEEENDPAAGGRGHESAIIWLKLTMMLCYMGAVDGENR